MEYKELVMNEEEFSEYQKALELIDTNSKKEAIKILCRLQEKVPKNIRIKFELGKLYVQNPKTQEKGKSILLELFRLNDLARMYNLADEEEKQNNNEKAFKVLKDARYLILINQDILIRLEEVELNEGNYNKASIYIQDLLNSGDINKIYVTYLNGILEKRLGNRKKAKQYFDRVICKNTRYSKDAMIELGDLENTKGNYDKASKYFEKLIYNNNYRNKALLGFAKIDKNKKNIEKAREEYKSLMSTELKNEALLGLGQLKALENSDMEAKEYFKRLLDTELRNEALLELGKLELKEGNNSITREYYNKLLKSRLKNEALLNLGKLEAIEGKEEIAKEYFYRLIEANALNKNDALEELKKIEEKKSHKVLVK